jgi:hypothetical protein
MKLAGAFPKQETKSNDLIFCLQFFVEIKIHKRLAIKVLQEKGAKKSNQTFK